MDVSNKRYQKQGIHVISSIFTIEQGIVKVLLVKRTNQPFQDMWALTGGALYNDEDLIEGAKRELYEKTGLKDVNITLSSVKGDVNRSPLLRMVAINFIGVVDASKVVITEKTKKTSNAAWFPISEIPELAYDHNSIIEEALEKLKFLILTTDILKTLFPKGFTLPEVQYAYESIFNTKFDRRNFRRKFLTFDFIMPTDKFRKINGRKPARIYVFQSMKKNQNIF